MTAWALFASQRKLLGVAAAADQDQAGLLRAAVDGLVRLNPWLGEILSVKVNKVVNGRTGSELTILASDGPSSYGLTPDFIVADELTHWRDRALWDSLLSAAAKRARCLLLVIANAGFSESWQWSTREAVRSDADWYFHRLEGPRASWITADRLKEQERLLPGVAFRRLWRNEWSDGAGDALEADLIRRAVTLADRPAGREPGMVYVGGLDLGLTRDASALVVVGKHVGYSERREVYRNVPTSSAMRAMRELGLLEGGEFPECEYVHHEGSGRLKLASVRTWKPTPGRKVELENVEQAILAARSLFGLSCVAFDPWQGAYLAERLHRAGVAMVPVQPTGANQQSMATATLEVFREGQIDLFDEPDLLADLRALRVVERSYGWRLESPRANGGQETGTRHGDTAAALMLALLGARRYRAESAARYDRPLVLSPNVHGDRGATFCTTAHEW